MLLFFCAISSPIINTLPETFLLGLFNGHNPGTVGTYASYLSKT